MSITVNTETGPIKVTDVREKRNGAPPREQVEEKTVFCWKCNCSLSESERPAGEHDWDCV